jgi:hypothetical protein
VGSTGPGRPWAGPGETRLGAGVFRVCRAVPASARGVGPVRPTRRRRDRSATPSDPPGAGGPWAGGRGPGAVRRRCATRSGHAGAVTPIDSDGWRFPARSRRPPSLRRSVGNELRQAGGASDEGLACGPEPSCARNRNEKRMGDQGGKPGLPASLRQAATGRCAPLQPYIYIYIWRMYIYNGAMRSRGGVERGRRTRAAGGGDERGRRARAASCFAALSPKRSLFRLRGICSEQ